MSDEIKASAPSHPPGTDGHGSDSISIDGKPPPKILAEDHFDVKVLDQQPAAERPKNNKFAFTPAQLHELILARSLSALRAFGGIEGLAAGLRTDPKAGLGVDESGLDGTITFDEALAAAREKREPEITPVLVPDSDSASFHLDLDLNNLDIVGHHDQSFADRKRIFGLNRLPKRKPKSFLALAWLAFNDKLIFLLTVSASVSLALGIYESVEATDDANRIQWVDGLTVVVAIIVIVFASAATDWHKDRKFAKLNERKEQRDVKVTRSGKTRNVPVHEVLVGDVMHVETGDVVAVDGVLISAAGVQVDESSVSGESELVHKSIVGDWNTLATRAHAPDPFIVSGTTVCGGIGTYLVLSVGEHSSFGRTLMSIREDVEETPLQQKLGLLAKQLITFGAIAGFIFFFVMFVRYLTRLRDMDPNPAARAEAFFEVLILAITVVIVTVPEGLSLAVTLALAFATKRMLRDNNLVRLIRSCEIMGNATCICSDKTGTLTQNEMTVVVGRLGTVPFGDCGPTISSAASASAGSDTENTANDVASGQQEASIPDFVASLDEDVKDLLKNSIALNSTAFESDDPANPGFVGTSTETALLKFGREYLSMAHLNEERENGNIENLSPFDASRKWMAVMRRVSPTECRMLAKGAAEVIVSKCTDILADPKSGMATQPITESIREEINASIKEYATNMLRPVVIAYRDFARTEAFEDPNDPESIPFDKHFDKLTFIGIFGIRDPLRPEVIQSVRTCQDAGVFVRMVTGDNFLTAKAIAAECGIYTPGGLAMDGPIFRRLTSNQLDLVIPRLQVLARSSPEDKLLLVSHLKRMGETVAVTGDGTNDALALKAADVGFAMGIQGTEVAKEAASIILLDDNFESIVKSLLWGRTVNDATKKFLQFQFTINISAGTLTVVSELAGNVIFNIVQLLWINLIMDIFASLGLATDYPSRDFLKRKPEPRTAPIVTITMWKMVLLVAIYQLAVIFTFHYAGEALFHPQNDFERKQLQTMVFNIYVWMQFFNQHNCRRVDNKINIWYQGVLRNPWFLGVQCVTLAGQMVIIWLAGAVFDTEPLNAAQWGWSMLFGALVIPLGALIRQIPDRFVLMFFRAVARAFRPVKRGFLAVVRLLTKPLPEKWRPKKHKQGDDEMGATEAWVLQTGAALLRPVNYQWGHSGPPQSGQVGRTQSITQAQREALAKALQSEENKQAEFDVVALVDQARNTPSSLGLNIEVHPGTAKDDPLLHTPGNKDNPPSQDPRVLDWVKVGSRAEGK
ncbi:plasma membrane calcium-transporting ATPase [Sodiomyces alkalinus F11]|uniref:Calcium-transporting ATPase n=1 Tax=Sodiomyces alkalinus (strain CBS 110278 / VKM F-3762 / F11) TaxID=1314773 RepID=A0A3N2Q723_SODAK|nr:plasma membrane calcium-transporting ATPase [Sodiomyces alkalinus F11]ROT42589.1 plasma membrane calcium-transporting ATPase [Sodiomyces alkalinus F11]